MARNWQPKYAVACRKCVWRGRRSRATRHRPCPRCRGKVDWTPEARAQLGYD